MNTVIAWHAVSTDFVWPALSKFSYYMACNKQKQDIGSTFLAQAAAASVALIVIDFPS